jgi:hypothetical protein
MSDERDYGTILLLFSPLNIRDRRIQGFFCTYIQYVSEREVETSEERTADSSRSDD